MESAKLIAALTRVTGDVGLAEELAQDALVAALEQWPETGVPDKPGAWLMATAKHRAIDTFRRAERLERKTAELGRELRRGRGARLGGRARRGGRGRRAAAGLHLLPPGALPRGARRADPPAARRPDHRRDRPRLPRRRVDGRAADRPGQADPDRRARAVRGADRRGLHRPARLGARGDLPGLQRGLLGHGRARTGSGRRSARRRMRLGRILAELTPGESEVHGLVALMEIQASRLPARVGAAGRAGAAARPGPRPLGPGAHRPRPRRAGARRAPSGAALGPYALQAAIAACHARARTVEDTDWPRIAALYEALAELTPSPVVELNRAVAVSRAYGPAAGLELVDALDRRPGAARLPPAAQRPRRPARAARPAGRGARRVRARRLADPQRAGAGAAAGPGRRLRPRRRLSSALADRQLPRSAAGRGPPPRARRARGRPRAAARRCGCRRGRRPTRGPAPRRRAGARAARPPGRRRTAAAASPRSRTGGRGCGAAPAGTAARATSCRRARR